MLVRVVRPQPGPQELAAASSADVLIYGGAAGGGKSWLSIFEAARWVHVDGYAAIVFRRHSTELLGGGGVWEESQTMYPALGGLSRESPRLEWRFPNGSQIEFAHLQHEKDVYAHQSKQYAVIIFEEMTHFTAKQFWYMRSRNRSTCGVRPYIRGTCNPDPDSFVSQLIAWWIGEDGYPIPGRSGVLRWFVRLEDDSLDWGDSADEMRAKHPDREPESLTFVAAALDDNPALTTRDPTYRTKLEQLPRVDRERLMKSNWKIKHVAGEIFRRSEFQVVEAVPGKIVSIVRAWDRAATEPSPANPSPKWTAGVKMARLDSGDWIILHVERMRERAAVVETRIKTMAVQDGAGCRVALFQDPGSAGKMEVSSAVKRLAGHHVVTERATTDKVTAVHPYSAQVQHGHVMLLRGSWNEAFLSEHEAFPPNSAGFADQVDAAGLAFRQLDRHPLAHA